MAQRRQLTWSELRVGLFVLLGIVVVAVAIFYVTGAGVLGPKYILKTYLPEVQGLGSGAPVSLDGVEVGNVEKVRLVPREPGKAPDRMHNIEITMRIQKKYQNYILTDSSASLVTEGLLGNRYVNVERGYTGRPLKEGEAIPGISVKAMKEIMTDVSTLSDSMRGILSDLQSGKGTLGKLMTDDAAYENLNQLLAKGNQIATSVQAGKGTLGKLVMTDEMYGKVNKSVDTVNALLEDVRSQKGTVGKLLYDPTLYDEAKKAMTSSNALLNDLHAGKGTLGKLVTDETLYNNLKESSSNISKATAKMNQSDNTIGKLFSDPKLYENVSGMAGDMQKLITEFRTNPKKYLHITVSLF
jgi:phospholipid/cholesterol/gamma-HCH transport system substrate-binding protein